jgi:hypothetical protein
VKEQAAVKNHLADLLTTVLTELHDDWHTIPDRMRDQDQPLPVLRTKNVGIAAYEIVTYAAGRPGMLQALANVVLAVDKSSLGLNFFSEVKRQLPGDFFALDVRLQFVAEIAPLIRAAELYMYFELVAGYNDMVELPDAAALLREVEELTVDTPCRPLVMLTEEIARRARRRTERQLATSWSDRLAELIDASRADGQSSERANLAALRKKRPRRISSPPRAHAVLSVMLDPWGPSPDSEFLLTAWEYRTGPESGSDPERCSVDDAPLSLDRARQEVVDQLKTLMVKLSTPGVVAEVFVEFFLPRSLLDLPVEDWVVSGDHITLGTLFVVVVRDRDRLRNPALWTPWQEKWQRIPTGRAGPGGPFSRWFTCADLPCRAGELRLQLLSEKHVCLGMTFPPPPGTQRLELAEALDAGTPIAVWPRGRCAHPVQAGPADACAGPQFREVLSKELAGKPLTELPRLVKEARIKRARAGAPGLALLWDDADRYPRFRPLDAPQ